MDGGWKIKKDNTLRGAYGETDFDKKLIRINKKRHKKGETNKNADGSENLLDTIVHEKLHATHPNMHEKTVRKLARAMSSKMGKKQKAAHYAMVK